MNSSLIRWQAKAALANLRLDDLMQVIEAPCPTYPERDTFADSAAFKL